MREGKMNKAVLAALAAACILAAPALALEKPATGKFDIEAEVPLDFWGGRWMTSPRSIPSPTLSSNATRP
jgi:hypothetical protein